MLLNLSQKQEKTAAKPQLLKRCKRRFFEFFRNVEQNKNKTIVDQNDSRNMDVVFVEFKRCFLNCLFMFVKIEIMIFTEVSLCYQPKQCIIIYYKGNASMLPYILASTLIPQTWAI